MTVWHGIKHESFRVSEVETGLPFDRWVTWCREEGGFYPTLDTFVPWHRIRCIERA